MAGFLRAWLAVGVLGLTQAPLPPADPPAPPPPIDLTVAVDVTMTLTASPRWFTAEDFKLPLDTIADNAYCEGRLVHGSYRYFADGTSPSALVGTLVPWPVDAPSPEDAEGTLEPDGETVILWDKRLVLGFKAVAATSNGAEISWTCQLQ